MAAGLILAASFATLALSTLPQQIGFTVAFGVLISAFVVWMVLVPGLTAVLGRVAWWPYRGRPRRHPHATPRHVRAMSREHRPASSPR